MFQNLSRLVNIYIRQQRSISSKRRISDTNALWKALTSGLSCAIVPGWVGSRFQMLQCAEPYISKLDLANLTQLGNARLRYLGGYVQLDKWHLFRTEERTWRHDEWGLWAKKCQRTKEYSVWSESPKFRPALDPRRPCLNPRHIGWLYYWVLLLFCSNEQCSPNASQRAIDARGTGSNYREMIYPKLSLLPSQALKLEYVHPYLHGNHQSIDRYATYIQTNTCFWRNWKLSSEQTFQNSRLNILSRWVMEISYLQHHHIIDLL